MLIFFILPNKLLSEFVKTLKIGRLESTLSPTRRILLYPTLKNEKSLLEYQILDLEQQVYNNIVSANNIEAREYWLSKYNDLSVAKFINYIMESGKKGAAEKIFYGARIPIKLA